MSRFIQNPRFSMIYFELPIAILLRICVFISGCNIRSDETDKEWEDITGYWKEYCIERWN